MQHRGWQQTHAAQGMATNMDETQVRHEINSAGVTKAFAMAKLDSLKLDSLPREVKQL
jgi:hypothetical protein